MDKNQILQIIKKGETQEVEFKQSYSGDQSISKTICAFANTLGGIIILGVNNKKEIIGITGNLDELQQKISSANQCVIPVPLCSIEIFDINNKKIIAIIIQRSPDNINYTFGGITYVRIGSTTKKIEGQTLVEFLRNKQILSFDETYCNNFTINDIDETKVKKYLFMRHHNDFFKEHTMEDFLLSNNLATKNGNLKIKNPAVLLFSKNMFQFIPVETNLVLFSGVEPVNIVAHVLIQDTIQNTIDQSISFVEKYISKKIEIEGTIRKELPEYPKSVIREAIVNALVHRDYYSRDSVQIYIFDNRIEITNPGSLPHTLPREMFGNISVRRNPLLYIFMRDMGYIEGLGTGIPRMKNAMRNAGLNDPKFDISENIFKITLYNKKGSKKPVVSFDDLNIRQKKALNYIKKHGLIKTKIYREINNISYVTAIKEINEMLDFEYIQKKGAGRNIIYILK